MMRYTLADLPVAKGSSNAMLRNLGKPIRTVLIWQFVATALITGAGALLWGGAGAVSAAAGGGASMVSGLASALVASLSTSRSAGGVLLAALRAEAVKIGLALFQLWLVLAYYREVVAPLVLGAFIVTTLVFSMAFFVRQH